MKNHSLYITALLMTGFIFVSCTGQSSPTSKSPSDANPAPIAIRIGVDPNLIPFESLDSIKNELVGFDIDVIKAIGVKTNIPIDLIKVKTGFKKVLSSVENCDLDAGISAIPISENLNQKMDFSDAYYSSTQVLVVKKGNIKISGVDTLSGMVIGTESGSSSQAEVEKLLIDQSKLFDTFYLAFEALISGNIDAVIADKPRASLYVKLKPNNIKIVGSELGILNYGIAVCKNKPDLLQQLNQGLASIKADGTLGNLKKKWFSADSP